MRKFKLLGISVAAALVAASSVCAQVTDAQFSDMMNKYLQTEAGQEKLAQSIETYFKRKREDDAKKQQEMAKKEAEEQFKNPVKIDVGSSPVQGPANAKVTIIEFSDFQCPFCSRGKATMDQVLKAYPNDVRLVFKHLPLDFHPQAMPAAKAANAAGKQGKFWEMHDKLFENQQALSDDLYPKLAQELGLNVEKFKKDFADPANEASVKADAELARKNGIQGTPGFFVNGVVVKGAYPLDHFKGIIDRWLAQK